MKRLSLLLVMLASMLARPAGGQIATNLAGVVAVGHGRSSGGNVVVEASIGGMGGTSGASIHQLQHGFVAQMESAPLRSALADSPNLTVFGEDGVNYAVQRSANLDSQMQPTQVRLALADDLTLTVFGEDGVNYTVQHSADLHSWFDAAALRTTNGVARLVLAAPSETSSSFYRVVGSE